MARAKIGVMGAGAVGSYIGGSLAIEGGADDRAVILVGRERVKSAIDAHGLHVADLAGKTRTAPKSGYVFTTDPTALSDCDVVLVCVKSGATSDAASTLVSVLRPDAVVVSFQNGLRNADELRERLEQTVLAGIVNFNVVTKAAGVFRRATSGPLFIERTPRAEELAKVLRRADFEVELPADIRGVQWSKLLFNLNNAVSALSDRPTKELVLSAGYRRVLSSIMGESLAVMQAAGIRPAKIGAIPMTLVPHALRLPTAIVRFVARAQLKIDPEARSSMWEDLTSGRATEVDWLNGEVVELAAKCGLDAPLNRRIVELVHEAEKAGAGSPKLSADALWAQLTSRAA